MPCVYHADRQKSPSSVPARDRRETARHFHAQSPAWAHRQPQLLVPLLQGPHGGATGYHCVTTVHEPLFPPLVPQSERDVGAPYRPYASAPQAPRQSAPPSTPLTHPLQSELAGTLWSCLDQIPSAIP